MNALERWKWRKAAYEAWLQSGGDKERAEQILRERYDAVDPATLLLILQFALKLFQWWIDHKEGKPEAVVMADESTAMDLTETD